MADADPPAISFFCRGTAVTEGSTRAFHRYVQGGGCVVRVVHDSAPKLNEWRALVATAAKRAMGHELPYVGPVDVGLTFYFPRPKDHTAAQRMVPYVYVNGRWDIDKLTRAILDAGTEAAIWQDDGQVAHTDVWKYYAGESFPPGVLVTVKALA